MKGIIKGLLVLVVACFLFQINHTSVMATTSEEVPAMEELDKISFDEVRTYWDHVVNEYGGYLPGLQKSSLLEVLESKDQISVKDWLKGMVQYLFHEIIVNGKLLGILIMLTLFSVLLQTLQSAFDNQNVSKVAYAIVYLVLIAIALNSFHLAADYAKDAIDTMSSFMIALLPLMLGLMATFGNVIAVSFFHPVIVFLIHISVVLVSNVVIPLFFLSALLNIVSTINEQYKVTQLANLFKNIGLGLLGLFLTIFLGVISVQGAASAVQDGVAMKTAKFVTGNFIPVVGRMFTDAADTALTASLLLKNAVGIVGVIIIAGLALFPALKVFSVAFIYKVSSALLQPIGNGPIITCLDIISKHILYILAGLLVVTFMFFLAIVIMVASSNLTLMLR
ncbi:stage III sporulation protein AE [Radiobacillus kanasensis]|uniref:stage III sporulation protein AE n=1 Tax=Radiobacillus kanasensis TaxID=2844358 RepID=UPI001E579679|nr:stage III sporulation protein AE [Radiobacillus kanasensis]UFT97738.1 stage III sporulation protein AE [Radiobacillus kanasensis]